MRQDSPRCVTMLEGCETTRASDEVPIQRRARRRQSLYGTPTLSHPAQLWCCLQFCFEQDALWKGEQNPGFVLLSLCRTLYPTLLRSSLAKRTCMLTLSFSVTSLLIRCSWLRFAAVTFVTCHLWFALLFLYSKAAEQNLVELDNFENFFWTLWHPVET